MTDIAALRKTYERAELDESAYERLSWRLASALSKRWPTSLGRGGAGSRRMS